MVGFGGIIVTDKSGKQRKLTTSKEYSQHIRDKKAGDSKNKIELKETKGSTENIFTGRVLEGGKVLAVRTVPKQEQQIRDVRRQQEFFSIREGSKPKAEEIAQKFAFRKGLGQGSYATIKADITQELKFTKTTPPPRELTKTEKTIKFLTSPLRISEIQTTDKTPKAVKFYVDTVKSLPPELDFQRFSRQILGNVRETGGSLGFIKNKKFHEFRSDISEYTISTLETPSTHIISYGFNIGSSAVGMALPKLAGSYIAKGGTIALGTAYTTYQGLEIATGRKTGGQAIGEAVGFGLSAIGTKPLAVATVKTPVFVFQKAKSGISQAVANYKFSRFEKSVYRNYPYKTFEQTGSSQRTLFGTSATGTPKRAGIGFGIEQNTLKPYKSSVLPTGQKRLVSDKIVALDIRGQFHKVKIVDYKPYVYNQRIGKYTEFVSGKYKLFTISPNIKPLYSVSLLDTTKQTGLNQFGFTSLSQTSKPSTPFGKTNLGGRDIGSSASPISPSKVFSTGTGIATVGIPQSMPIAKTQYTTLNTYTYSPTYTNFPVSSISLGGREDSIKALFPSVSFKPKVSQGSKLGISIKQDFRSDVMPISSVKPFSDVTPISAVIPISDTSVTTINRSASKLESSYVSQLSTSSISTPVSSSYSFTSPAGITPPSFPVSFPEFRFSIGKGGGLFKSKAIKVSQPKAFNPSVRASAFNLRGTTGKGSILSGIGERFIPKRRKL